MRGAGSKAFSFDNQAVSPGGNTTSTTRYDGNGNPQADNAAAVFFDPENRLTSAGTQAGGMPVDMAQGGDGLTRLLWQDTDGTNSIWLIQSNGVPILQKKCVAYPGWTAVAIAAGPNANSPTRILWNNTSGQVSLWTLDHSGNFTNTQYGPYPGYTAKALAVDSHEHIHILWSHAPDGQVSLWNLNLADGSNTPATYGPYPGSTATDVAVGPDDIVHLLWTNTAGVDAYWNLDGSAPNGFSAYTEGPFSGWQAQSLSVGPDTLLHILWTCRDGSASVRTNSASGVFQGYSLFGPYTASVPMKFEVGADNEGHLLWNNTAGVATLWNVASNNSATAVFSTGLGTVSGTGATFGYTGDGLRAWKRSASGTTYFLYDGSDPVCELSSSGVVTATTTFGANGLVSRNTPGSGTVFYAFDERGNVAQRTSSSGAVLSSDLYDAYGKRLAGASDVYGFGAQAGYRTDAETGLLLLTHRYYDPQTGRFLTRDPLGYAGGINLYGYTQNNPINRNDPSGEASASEWTKIGVAAWLFFTGNVPDIVKTYYQAIKGTTEIERPLSLAEQIAEEYPDKDMPDADIPELINPDSAAEDIENSIKGGLGEGEATGGAGAASIAEGGAGVSGVAGVAGPLAAAVGAAFGGYRVGGMLWNSPLIMDPGTNYIDWWANWISQRSNGSQTSNGSGGYKHPCK